MIKATENYSKYHVIVNCQEIQFEINMEMRIHDIVQPNKNVPPALDQRESDNDCGELDDQAKFKDEMQDRERSIDKRSVHK